MALNGDRPLGRVGAAVRAFDRNAVATVLAGISVPLIVLGPSGFQAPIALALALALPGRLSAGLPGRLPSWLAGFAVVLVFWIPSLVVSLEPGTSLFLWARTAALIYGVAVIQALLAEDAERHALFLKFFLAGLAAAMAAAVLSLYADQAPIVALRGAGAYHRAASNILQPTASVLLLTVPVALCAAWRLGGRGWALAAGWCVVAFPLVATGSDSRSALAGLLAMGLVAALLAAWRHRRYRLAIAAAFLVAAAAVVWFVVNSWENWIVQESSLGPLHLYLPVWMVGPHRQVIWRFVAEHILDKPLFGWGIGAANYIPGAHRLIPVVDGYYVPSHPHNWLLEIVSETGLVGAVPFLALLAWWAWRLARRYLRDGAPEALALVALLFGFFGAASFNFSIWRVWWHLTAMVLAAAILAVPKTAQGLT